MADEPLQFTRQNFSPNNDSGEAKTAAQNISAPKNDTPAGNLGGQATPAQSSNLSQPITPIPPKTLPTEEATLSLENFHTMARDIADFKKSHGAVRDTEPISAQSSGETSEAKPVAAANSPEENSAGILEGLTPGPLEEVPTELLPTPASAEGFSVAKQPENEEVSALTHALETTEDTIEMDGGKELTLESFHSLQTPAAQTPPTPSTSPAVASPTNVPSNDPKFVLFPEAKKIVEPATPPAPIVTPIIRDLDDVKPRPDEQVEIGDPLPKPEPALKQPTTPIAENPTENPSIEPAVVKPQNVAFTQVKSEAGLEAFVGMPKNAAAIKPPTVDTYRESIEEAPAPVTKPPEPEIISPIHTLKSDVTTAVARHNITLSGIAIKEDSRRRMEAEAVVKKSYAGKMLWAAAFILFVSGAGALGYVLYLKKTPEEKIIQQVEEVSLIFSESKIQFDITNLPADALQGKMRSHLATTNVRIGTIEDIVVTRRVETEKSTQYALVTAPELLTRFGLTKNTSLDRFLEPQFMLGVYSFKNFSGFLILKTNFYQSVFAEMLAWEPKLGRDAGFLVSDKTIDEDTLARKWEDLVVENIDVRVLKNADGEVVMLWSFLGTRDTLLIAQNLDTFKEVVAREKTPRQVYR